jgi:hypothetical protein
MAPPTTVRQAPTGIKLKDGFKTTIAFAADPDVSLWERSVKPPGLNGGDAIDTTTMHNTKWRTRNPRKLKTMTNCTGKAAYDPDVYNQLINLINVETAITIRFTDGSTLDFYGALTELEFDELQEGNFPECNYVIVPTNQDPVTGAEVDPVLTSVAGT